MTTMTLAPTNLGDQDPAYYAGRADAYDDHQAGTPLQVLIVRLGYLIDDHPNTVYVAGYAERVWEIDREQAADAAAQAEHAFRKADAR